MSSDADHCNEPGSSEKVPHLLSQLDLNDLVRELGLTKEKSELLGSWLKQLNPLHNFCKLRAFSNTACTIPEIFNGKRQYLFML